jgi:hypothetical protein
MQKRFPLPRAGEFFAQVKFRETEPIRQVSRMNTSASTLLRALATVGVRTVHFRVLSQYDAHKHTTPIAMLDEEHEGTGHKMPRFSIPDLFNAYALTPRKGYYTLEVNHGQLSFVPPKIRSTSSSNASQLDSSELKRWKPKVTRRRSRAKSNRLRKFPSA